MKRKSTKIFLHTLYFTSARHECRGLEANAAHACLKFQIPPDVEQDDVHQATLWVYKKADIYDTSYQTFEASDVTHWDKERHFFKAKPIALTDTNTKGMSN